MRPRWSRIALFYGATFGLTHLLSVAYVVAGGSWGTPSSFAVANALALCPAMVAMSLQRFFYREPVGESLGLRFRPNGWFAFAWLFPPLVMLLALGVSLLLPEARYAGDMSGLPPEMDSFRQQVISFGVAPIVGMLALGLLLGPTLNAIGGLGEEIGWRGFLYKELLPLGFWRCSFVTGALWALWHVPLFFEGGYVDRQYPMASAVGMIAFAVLLAPLLHFVRGRSRSVVACGILHGTMSSSRLLSSAFVRGAGPWGHGAIPVVLLAANFFLLVACDREQVAQGSKGVPTEPLP
jgi:membrane protease YdiL (CAAX protease family)